MSTRAHQLLAWARWIQSTTFHHISLVFIWKLLSHLSLGLQSGFFLQVLHVKCYPDLVSPTRATCLDHLILRNQTIPVIKKIRTCSMHEKIRNVHKILGGLTWSKIPLGRPVKTVDVKCLTKRNRCCSTCFHPHEMLAINQDKLTEQINSSCKRLWLIFETSTHCRSLKFSGKEA